MKKLIVAAAVLSAMLSFEAVSGFSDYSDFNSKRVIAEENLKTDFLTELSEYNGNKEIIIKGYEGKSASLVIPSEIGGVPVSEIASNAFKKNKTLKEVVVSSGIEKIGYAAFSGCTSLEKITVPETVENVCAGSFTGTPWLELMTKENEYLVLGNGVLVKYSGKDKTPKIPENVKTIGREAFSKNTNIENIKISGKISSVNEYAFSDCSNLKNIRLGSSVKKIEKFAFYNCGIEKINIPLSVNNIGSSSIGFYTDIASKYSGPVWDFVITGYSNSTAYNYSLLNDIKFESFRDSFDVNRDCFRDSEDVKDIKTLVMCSDDIRITEKQADVNKDDKVNVFDVIREKKSILNASDEIINEAKTTDVTEAVAVEIEDTTETAVTTAVTTKAATGTTGVTTAGTTKAATGTTRITTAVTTKVTAAGTTKAVKTGV